MNNSFLHKKTAAIMFVLLSIPIIMVIVMAFFYNDGVTSSFSLTGFKELLSPLRLGELLIITQRALIVCLISTGVSFAISYLLFAYTCYIFQAIFFIAVTLPFLVNESVRVFSWQYVLSENGILNHFFSFVTRRPVTMFNSSNSWNIYFIMIITCIPFGIFICSACLKTIPKIYWSVSNDLNLRPFSKLFKVAIPLSKFALVASAIVIFFIAFSLSSEVNYLGGDTKISTRNLVLSLMSASKFQAIFSLGFLIVFFLFLTTLGLKYIHRSNSSTLL